MPIYARAMIKRRTECQLPKFIKHDDHFKPSYNPLEERICLCPDGDFYHALCDGKGNIVTSQISGMTSTTIKLQNGKELSPDIIVTATGLKIQLAGGMKISVDEKTYDISSKFIWKNTMLQDLPNATYTIGYVDASWTLAADATALLMCRLWKKMEMKGVGVIIPRVEEQSRMNPTRLLKLKSTYLKEAGAVMPKAGDQPQWEGRTSPLRDFWESRYGDIETGLEFVPFEKKAL
jgi:cation diffusion facilitator CzcD-associated flavoprotein CzcO